MRRPRHLSAEERALWDQVTRADAPLKGRGGMSRLPSHPVSPVAAEKPVSVDTRPPLPAFQVGERADHRGTNDLLSGLAEDRAGLPAPRMDAKALGKLRRGKLRPEARIDLHGMTLAEAHPALIGFVLSSHAVGRRLVLVITGKGKLRDDFAPMPTRRGLLRHQVPQWLTLPPLGPVVLQVTPAHISHGGEGALYVYLSRRRQG
ncbi:MAG: Smr/MutS family protein [Rubellimicrobium sp.]|nr:Smr/MutS family protein [Rubellimicrobium sp.]